MKNSANTFSPLLAAGIVLVIAKFACFFKKGQWYIQAHCFIYEEEGELEES